ncbi:MAG: hypothetical protein HS122_13820 [Opitutaceae bacterium]|nr:hypothetical protein [Opitutaceae bacterium]
MKFELCAENTTATDQLRVEKNDRSGIGVHYVDAWLKPLKAGVALPDGQKFSAKRRGLKVTLTLGTQKADGLMRRLTVSRDPIEMLRAALDEAGAKLGLRLTAEGGRLFLENSAG